MRNSVVYLKDTQVILFYLFKETILNFWVHTYFLRKLRSRFKDRVMLSSSTWVCGWVSECVGLHVQWRVFVCYSLYCTSLLFMYIYQCC